MKINNLNPSQYKRFFSFGCSFTNYFWPTWSDIIGRNIPFYENWAQKGMGNHFIFNSVIEAHTRYNFTEGDLVMIMWSATSREDRYSWENWSGATNQYQAELYGDSWYKKYGTDTRAHLVRDFAYMRSTQLLLNSLNCDWAQLAMSPLGYPIGYPGYPVSVLYQNHDSDTIIKKYNEYCDLWKNLCVGKLTIFLYLKMEKS